MKNTKAGKPIFSSIKLILLFVNFCLLIFSSCKKVIDVNLNDSDPKIVIEAEIFDSSNCTVKLTQSVNFDEPNIFPPITDAIITISDNVGHSEILCQTSPGLYSSSALMGIPGREYILNVTIGGNSYSATSSMPYPVEIDTIAFESIGAFGNSTQMANISFLDPAGVKNYYHFIEVVNGNIQTPIFIYEDRFDDGKPISTTLLNDPGQGGDNSDISSGDTVLVLLQCTDKGVYEYLSTLSQSGSGMQSSTPANPKSNFSNGALGFFNACSVRKFSIVVP
ncbi:MAG: DUF4249 domain-containing protein [Bacteroidota bacterium]